MTTSSMVPETSARTGGTFSDGHRRERGRASDIVVRERGIGRLVFLDVTTTDRELSEFLGSLDRSPIQVQLDGAQAAAYRFSWASGYRNGSTIRVQGILI